MFCLNSSSQKFRSKFLFLQGLDLQLNLKRDYRCFPVNFFKIFENTFFIEAWGSYAEAVMQMSF